MFSLPLVAVLTSVLGGAVADIQGQPPAASAPLSHAAGAAALGGRVLDEATEAPLPRARVILTSPALAAPRVAITAADGAFRFERLPPGSYVVEATRSGYAAGAHGERRFSGPRPVTVGPAQQVSGIDVRLAPAGVIAGRILDEDNRPFTGAIVQALRSRLVEGRPTLVPAASATTDDRGEFRLAGLPAGEYHVAAFDPAFEAAGDETGPLRYTPTYYPGTPFADKAVHVAVTPGVEPKAAIVFALQIVKPARVTGSIATPDDRQLASGHIIMSPTGAEGVTSVSPEDVTIRPDGSFAFRNVPPGGYEIRARGELPGGETSLFATFRILVEGRDVSNVDMVLLPGASMEGRVIVEPVRSRAAPALPRLRVRAPFSDGSTFGDTPTGDVRPDGSFHIRGLMAGSHSIGVEGLPDPWVIESVSYRGQDVTDTGILAQGRQRLREIRITITDVATDVSGVVRDAAGHPVPEVTVVFVPLAETFWHRTSRRFGLTRSGEDGRYRIRGLPAGEYRVVATIDVDEPDVYRRDVLRGFVERGLPLSLAPREVRALDLALTATAARRHTVSR